MRRGSYLDDAVAAGVEAGRLDVDEHDLVLEAEDRVAGALDGGRVRRGDIRIGARNEETGQACAHHRTRLARRPDVQSERRAGVQKRWGCSYWAPAIVRDFTRHVPSSIFTKVHS
jgi:hypothetical protein